MATLLSISEASEAVPATRQPRSARLKLLVATAVVLAAPSLFTATALAQGCSAG